MPPVYAGGSVYFQTNGSNQDSYLWAVDASTHATRYKAPYSSQWSVYFAPVVAGTTVFMGCGSYDGLCAMRTSDGTRLWFASTNQYDGWTPAVAGGVAYAYTGSYTPQVQAFDATTGKQLYNILDPHFGWNGWTMGVAPVLGGRNDLLATQAGRLVAFDLAGQKIGWEVSSGFTGSVSVAGGVLYVIHSGKVEARSESDGSLQWAWAPPEGQVQGNLIVTNNILFARTAANTYAVDLSAQRQVWGYPASGELALSAQGTLFIAAANGTIVAIGVK